MRIKAAIQAAMEKLGISKLREHQRAPIQAITEGKDSLIVYPTSSGKSAIFQIPGLILQKGYVLVIEPMIALLKDQVDKLQSHGIEAHYISRKNKGFQHHKILNMIQDDTLRFLYTTPESIEMNQELRCTLLDHPPAILAVDEAHCIVEWGNFSFRPAYAIIGDFIDSLEHRPTIVALTATAPEEYRDQIIDSLGMKKPAVFTHSLARHNITIIQDDWSHLPIQKRLTKVHYYIKKYCPNEGSVVVYCSSRGNVDAVYNYLSDQKRFPNEVAKCHAGIRTGSKKSVLRNEQAQEDFSNGDKRIMVATSAFGMGVDKADIRLVIHFNMPLSIIDYYQQIGRAGRDGERSYAVMMYADSDIKLNQSLLKKMNKKSKAEKEAKKEMKNPSTSDAPLRSIAMDWNISPILQKSLSSIFARERWMELRQERKQAYKTSKRRFKELVQLLQSEDCFMQQILTYLGEEDPKQCRFCTNCQRKRRT